MIIKLNKLNTGQKKDYRIQDNELYINDTLQDFDFSDEAVSSYNVTDNEDYESITRDEETKEVTILLNVYTDAQTVKSYFTINATEAGFPYHREEGKLVMSADIKDLEGVSF